MTRRLQHFRSVLIVAALRILGGWRGGTAGARLGRAA